MGLLKQSSAPYSNRWFTVPKKNNMLHFIQDLQPVNKVTIRNAGIRPTIGEFAEAFAGRSIYSVGDLYSVYGKDILIYVTVYTSPTGIGWMISQEDDDDTRFPIQFGAKVLSER